MVALLTMMGRPRGLEPKISRARVSTREDAVDGLFFAGGDTSSLECARLLGVLAREGAVRFEMTTPSAELEEAGADAILEAEEGPFDAVLSSEKEEKKQLGDH
jgi:hypothetical protein